MISRERQRTIPRTFHCARLLISCALVSLRDSPVTVDKLAPSAAVANTTAGDIRPATRSDCARQRCVFALTWGEANMASPNLCMPSFYRIAHPPRLSSDEKVDVVIASVLSKLRQERDDVVCDAVTWKRQIRKLAALDELRPFDQRLYVVPNAFQIFICGESAIPTNALINKPRELCEPLKTNG